MPRIHPRSESRTVKRDQSVVAEDVDRLVAVVDEFMRGWGYAPISSDAEMFLVERYGVTAETAEAAVTKWESLNERPEEGRPT